MPADPDAGALASGTVFAAGAVAKPPKPPVAAGFSPLTFGWKGEATGLNPLRVRLPPKGLLANAGVDAAVAAPKPPKLAWPALGFGSNGDGDFAVGAAKAPKGLGDVDGAVVVAALEAPNGELATGANGV